MGLIKNWTSQNLAWSGNGINGKVLNRPQLNPYAGMKILVIDDDPTQRLLMRDALETAGYIVEEACDGPDGIAMAYRTKPDLIILDILMPKLDGFAVCAEVRRIEATKDIPILVATGVNEASAIQEAFIRGASDFVIKPIKWSVLALRTKYILRNHARTVSQQLSSVGC